MENNNSVARRNYYSSNHLDPAKEILSAEARMFKLKHCIREKRGYNKVDKEYWERTIFSKRQRNEISE